MTTRTLLSLSALAVLLVVPTAPACTIPVFRVALERWRPEHDGDLYQVLVFHRGPLAADDQAALDELQRLSKGSRPLANLVAELVDVTEPMNKSTRAIWEAQRDPVLPWVVGRYPNSKPSMPSAWTGRLSAAAGANLVDSPARRQLARLLLTGEASVVWLLLESGDTQQDEAAAALAQRELRRLEQVLKLPDDAGDGPVKLLTDVPLRLTFSLLRVARHDPAEKTLAALLRNGDLELTPSPGPVLFPIFGRGRVLVGLSGKHLTAEEMGDAAQFLCTACSCRVRPGTDLLMAVPWDDILFKGQPIPEVPSADQAVSIPPASSAPAPAPTVAATAPDTNLKPPLRRSVLLASVGLAGVLVVVSGAFVLAGYRRRRDRTVPPGSEA